MRITRLPPLQGLRVHFVGAKGTGMAALAEIFAARGAILTGSDVADHFYTDEILTGIGLKPSIGFDASHLPGDARLVVHSAAYAPDRNPELIEAARRGLPVMTYPEALGALSRETDSSGIAGVHGKTTSTAMAGTVIDALGLSATVLAGSAVSNFGGRCTLVKGDRHFVAETCEYRRHFLNFSPSRILLTSVESDHQDYYPTLADIMEAFVEYCLSLPPGGELIYCADDQGASEVARRCSALRSDIRAIPYGFDAEGPWRIENFSTGEGETRFTLSGAPGEFSLKVPGKHLVLDATGALALVAAIVSGDRGGAPLLGPEWEAARVSLAEFRGSRRRSEIVGESGGILFMDDYAHHPTAIAATIGGIKAFHPGRRLVVDFMSHTYSRTAALLGEFAAALAGADALVLHKIYASAREEPLPGLDGRTLYRKALAAHPELVEIGVAGEDAMRGGALSGGVAGENAAHGLKSRKTDGFALYTEEPEDAAVALSGLLAPGDLFLTMGAGDNWKLGKTLLDRFAAKETKK
ncbi:MAG: UDP-N-acetylmuramate--L-alanine ligase [Rectinemataceae bacterium]